MKDFTKELKNILKEDPGAPILSPDEVRGRANTMVILTNQAPPKLLALGGSSRKAILVNYKPLMITFPDQRGVYQVEPDDIVFENHHTGRDVTEAGSEETSYEKFFAGAMKKFGVSSPIELSPDDTKKFFDYVDKNWDAEEESDGSKTEILPALARGAIGVGSAVANVAGALGGDDENEDGWEDPPKLGGEPSLITPIEDVSTGKVGKKDKGSYQHAYKLALKKYQIHSADELDTPAERKGFTDYVDRLWKKGDIHRDKKEAAVTKQATSTDKVNPALRKRLADKKKADKKKADDAAAKEKPTKEKKKSKWGEFKDKRSTKKDKRKQEKEKKDKEKEKAAREKEREQKANEKDNGDNGNGKMMIRIRSLRSQSLCLVKVVAWGN